MKAAIGIDLGGTQLRVARLDAQGQILDHRKTQTAARAGPAVVIDQICALVDELRAAALADTAAPTDDSAGIGVCVAGPVDPDAGVVLEGWTMAGWHNIPLRDLLAARTGLSVTLANDGNAAALGEWRFGSGQGCRHFVYVTVSTGIGGGVIVDGRLLLGHKGMAGEIGHMILDRNGPRCNCGATGCWEAFASGTALAQRATELQATAPDSHLHRLAQDRSLTAKDVVDAAHLGDALARRLVQEEGAWLGIGMTALLHLYSPERIVMGGGLSNALPLLLPEIEREIRNRAMPPFRDVPIVLAALGDNAGVIGAGALVFREE
jgi:glucokinase